MEFCAFIGVVTMMIIIICIIGAAIQSIKDTIDELAYKYRFDKPPTTKCYCVDCVNYDIETHRCYGSGHYKKN